MISGEGAMRKRRVGAAAAFVISVSVGTTGLLAVAHADTTGAMGTTLYVDSANSACTDTGTGTAAAPYCTVQPAADAAVAGDTVHIASGTYRGGVTVSHSGTSTAPIVFEGMWTPTAITAPTTLIGTATAPVISLAGGVQDVQFKGMTIGGAVPIALSGVSDVLFDHDALNGAVQVSGASSAVAVEQSYIDAPLTVTGAATGTVISANVVATAISVVGATGTDITGNTISSLKTEVALSGGSTDTTIEDNVVTVNPASVTLDSAAVSVAADSTATTVERYDSFLYNSRYTSFHPTYSWGGTDYYTVAAFQAASGQGVADLAVSISPSTDILKAIDSSINSADSSAPGELSTDYYGKPRVDDLLVPETGTGSAGAFYDRGAIELQDTFTAGFLAEPDISDGETALTGEAGFSNYSNSWSATITETIGWGDGTTSTVPNSVQAGEGVGETLVLPTHKYARPGTYTVTGTMTDGTVTVSGSGSLTTHGSDFTPYGPVRVLDTRNGTGAAKAKVKGGTSVSVQIEGNGSIPASGVTAVALNLTATDTVGSGFVTAYSNTYGLGNVSNLNYSMGQTVPNAVIVPVGTDGKVEFYDGGGSGGSIDLIADVTGYFTQTASSGYTALPSHRLLDTRNGTGAVKAKVRAGGAVSLAIAGADGGVLPAGITAVALNVTATNTAGSGFITVHPDGASVPNASNLNYVAGQTIANTVIVPVGADGKIDLYNGGGSAGPVDLIADVFGYYSTGSAGAYVPISPVRVIDTRSLAGLSVSKGASLSTYPYTAVPGAAVPVGVSAYVLNITVTGTHGSGFITAYPTGHSVPNVSNLNYTPGVTAANLAQVETPDELAVSLYNGGASAGPVQLIEDVFGFYSTN
jgi:hypothetical protein